MAEKAFYGLAVSAVPAHVEVKDTQRSALNLFGPESRRTSRWTFDAACKPELSAAAGRLEACETERPVPENHTSTYLRYIRVLGGYTERRCVHSLVKSVVLTFTLPS
jgi:hypothetical protein